MNKRILYIDGSISDFSVALNNYKGASKELEYIVGTYLYIGSKLPFNNLYFKLKTPNPGPAQMKVEYYSDKWNEMAELIDETQDLNQSGFINFTPDRESRWSLKNKSSEVEGLENVLIYDQYWMRISFATNFSCEIQWVGNLFSTDDDLFAEFPDMERENFMSAYQAGKTDWQEQAAVAAGLIEKDLINRHVIKGVEQIVAKEWYKDASVQKTAEIIFSALGDDFVDQRRDAREEYKIRLAIALPRIDENNDASEDVVESRTYSGFLSR